MPVRHKRRPLVLFVLLCIVFACKVNPRVSRSDFQPIQNDLRGFIQRQVVELDLPGVWIAVLEIDPKTGLECIRADAITAAGKAEVLATHRVASISKLVTATAAMALVERGLLDLDAPVSRYLPNFQPRSAFGTEITLRHLMGHRSGLVREPPVGHFYDPTEPSLRATVASLNATQLTFDPGSQYKYSNPGFGVIGQVVAKVHGRQFEDAAHELVLDPLGLSDSTFSKRLDLLNRQALGAMWTYDGREISTPDFRLGYVPAVELRSTVVDLVRFARSTFPDASPRVLRPGTQDSMWSLPDGHDSGCGLAYFVSPFEGLTRVGHDGAVYGFASSLMALPEAGIAVAVIIPRDYTNDISGAIAERALSAALAARQGITLSAPEYPRPIGIEAAGALAGHWLAGENWVELYERDGELHYDPNIGVRTRLRVASDGVLVADDPIQTQGARRLTLLPNGNLHDGAVEYFRDDSTPPPAPESILPLLGEYGENHNTLIVYEDRGQLAVLIEWFIRDIPVREAPDRYRFLPGIYGGDAFTFERNEEGQGTAAIIGGARFERREPSTIPPLMNPHPIRRMGGIGANDSADLATLAPTLRYEFIDEEPKSPSGYISKAPAEALLRAHRSLAASGLGLHVYGFFENGKGADARDEERTEAIHPTTTASDTVELTLYEIASGERVPMPSEYGDSTVQSLPDYPGGTCQQRHFREMLRRTMTAEGFTASEKRWWRFHHGE